MFETLDDSEQNKEDSQTDDSSQEQDQAFSFEGPPTVAFFFAGALVFVSFFFGRSDSMKTFSALTYLAVAVFTIGVFWRLRTQLSFWATFVALLLLHLPVVLYSPLSTFWLHQKGLVFVDVADFLVYLMGISAINKLISSFKKN